MKGNVFSVFCGLVVIVVFALTGSMAQSMHTLASPPAHGHSTLDPIPMVWPVADPVAGAGVVYTWEVTILPKRSSKTSTIFVQGRDRGDAQREAEARYPGCQVMSIKRANTRSTSSTVNHSRPELACLHK